MARKSKRAALVLTSEQRSYLNALAASRSAAMREVERAKMMLGYADGASITELQRSLGLSCATIYRCVDKALAAGVQMGLKDGGFKTEVQHLPPSKVRRCKAPRREDINNSSLKTA